MLLIDMIKITKVCLYISLATNTIYPAFSVTNTNNKKCNITLFNTFFWKPPQYLLLNANL